MEGHVHWPAHAYVCLGTWIIAETDAGTTSHGRTCIARTWSDPSQITWSERWDLWEAWINIGEFNQCTTVSTVVVISCTSSSWPRIIKINSSLEEDWLRGWAVQEEIKEDKRDQGREHRASEELAEIFAILALCASEPTRSNRTRKNRIRRNTVKPGGNKGSQDVEDQSTCTNVVDAQGWRVRFILDIICAWHE